MTISERIFKILEEKEMSQSAFARQVVIAGSTISDWKTKKTNPSADKIMDICTVLEVTPEQLLTGREIDEVLQKRQSELRISTTDIQILEDIHGMKEAQRKRLMTYIQALKKLEALEELE